MVIRVSTGGREEREEGGGEEGEDGGEGGNVSDQEVCVYFTERQYCFSALTHTHTHRPLQSFEALCCHEGKPPHCYLATAEDRAMETASLSSQSLTLK